MHAIVSSNPNANKRVGNLGWRSPRACPPVYRLLS